MHVNVSSLDIREPFVKQAKTIVYGCFKLKAVHNVMLITVLSELYGICFNTDVPRRNSLAFF